VLAAGQLRLQEIRLKLVAAGLGAARRETASRLLEHVLGEVATPEPPDSFRLRPAHEWPALLDAGVQEPRARTAPPDSFPRAERPRAELHAQPRPHAARPAELHGVRIDWADPFESARLGVALLPTARPLTPDAYERARGAFAVRHDRYAKLRAGLKRSRERFYDAAVSEEARTAPGADECAQLAAEITRDAAEVCVLHDLLAQSRDQLSEWARTQFPAARCPPTLAL
jgi:hypothetical protein